jgi:hypothetical protein
MKLDDLVHAFPHTENVEFAEAFYGQAYAMVELLQALCGGRANCGPAELIAALKDERADPNTLFAWAIRNRAGDLGMTPFELLSDFVSKQFRLTPALVRAVTRRR